MTFTRKISIKLGTTMGSSSGGRMQRRDGGTNSRGIHMSKAMVAMSGGVDSSVAASLLVLQGYETIGITLKLLDNEDIVEDGSRTCCSLDDVEYARSVAFKIGIPYYVLNFTADFRKEVISRFADAYLKGMTPNPCLCCNRYIKFDKLLDRALQLGQDYMATGHYANIELGAGGRVLLKEAADRNKDQTYVLYALTQKQLAHTLFPLGSLKKEEVRRIAAKNGLINAKKPDSQDICFVRDGDYAAFIERFTGMKSAPGDLTDADGKAFGRHKGIVHYTIGQRKGLGLSSKEPLYVISKCPEKNTVAVGSIDGLYRRSLTVNDINLIAVDTIESAMRAKVKIRYSGQAQPAVVEQVGSDRIHIEFDNPQFAIASGQAAVIYNDGYVVGGGTIK